MSNGNRRGLVELLGHEFAQRRWIDHWESHRIFKIEWRCRRCHQTVKTAYTISDMIIKSAHAPYRIARAIILGKIEEMRRFVLDHNLDCPGQPPEGEVSEVN